MKKYTIVAFFETAVKARRAVQELYNNDFKRDQVDLAAQATETQSDDKAPRQKDDQVGSSIGNFFSSLFEDDDTRTAYTEVGRRSTVVTVHADSEASAKRAASILDKYEAVDVKDRAESIRKSGDQSIPIIKEELKVGKTLQETGEGVRLKSRIIEKPVEEKLRLRHEHVYVNRDRVNRPATEADFKKFEEGTFELKERSEVPVVEKKARVVEEVSAGKKVDHENKTVRDTVRETKVDVDKNFDRERRTRTEREKSERRTD